MMEKEPRARRIDRRGEGDGKHERRRGDAPLQFSLNNEPKQRAVIEPQSPPCATYDS
jgi:hypothetical protein